MNTIKKRFLWLLFLAMGLNLVSCVDKNIDYNNVASDIYYKGNLDFPIIHVDSVTIRDLLKEYGSNSDSTIYLDTLDYPNQDALIALYYKNSFEYGLRTDDKINESFMELEQEFGIGGLNLVIPRLIPISSQQYEGLFSLNRDIPTKHSGNDGDRYWIYSIDIIKADIDVKLFPDNTVAHINEITIGDNQTFYPVNNKLNGVSLRMDSASTFNIKFDMSPGTLDSIAVTVSTLEDFTIYGWFDFTLSPDKLDSVSVDIASYTEGSHGIQFIDPRFELTVKNYNLGVPLVMNLQSISTVTNSATRLLDFNSPGGYEFKLPVAELNSVDVPLLPIYLNKDEHATYGFDSLTYTQLLDIDVNNLFTNYGFYTNLNDYTEAESSGFTNLSKLQFISSQAKIGLDVKAVLPFWLHKGVLQYSDTVKGVDLVTEDMELDEDIEVTLYFEYVNNLPLPLNVDITFLDEDNLSVAIEKKSFPIKRGVVGSDGLVSSSTTGEFSLSLSKTEYDMLKDVENIILKYSTEPDNDENYQQEIKLRTSDWISLKISASIKGGITIN
ncbi:MAG: hypothetical protein LBJ17_05705 [Dysgonamonadaceae bacterium]|jgi:hypothetical protein|nr:hypothetical protein [Dysgonamonadaceae bacterium]